MAEWQSSSHLEDHFIEHGRELGCRTVIEYDISAQATLMVGTYFTYYHEGASEERTGCYDRSTGRFVALNSDDEIVSHFRCEGWYLKGLPYSTYEE